MMKGCYVIGVCIKMQTPYPLDDDLSLPLSRSDFPSYPLSYPLLLGFRTASFSLPITNSISARNYETKRMGLGSGRICPLYVHGGRSDLVERWRDVNESVIPKYRDPWGSEIQGFGNSETFNCSNERQLPSSHLSPRSWPSDSCVAPHGRVMSRIQQPPVFVMLEIEA